MRKKIIRNGAVETFNESICSGRTDFGGTMFNVIEGKYSPKGWQKQPIGGPDRKAGHHYGARRLRIQVSCLSGGYQRHK